MIERKDIASFEGLDFFAKQAVEGFITGLHKSPFHGFSVEFAEHRLYNKGESTKHIDWKLFARSDKLFVKRYEEETNLRCRIIIDTSSSMLFPQHKQLSIENPNKLIFSAFCAAALMILFKKQRDAVGLSLFSKEIEFHSPEKTTNSHHQILMNQLESIIKDSSVLKSTFAVKAIHDIAEMIHQRSLVVLFSDMMDSEKNTDDIFDALQHLKFNKHEVILFHVVDVDKEIDFNYSNVPHKFIDLETSEEIKLSPSSIKEEYIALKKKEVQDLKLKCAQFKIDFVEVDIKLGFEKVLSSYLNKRNKMR